MKGYQADIDAENQFTGQIYEERGRGFLAMRGQASYVPDGGKPRVIGKPAAERRRAQGDHQEAVIGTRCTSSPAARPIMQVLNGAVTSIVVDDDTANRKQSGLIGSRCTSGRR
jgi:hypothetical protein